VTIQKKINKKAHTRAARVRHGLKGRSGLPRLSVFRSLSNIYVQIIDDSQHHTLVACSSNDIEVKGDKKTVAFQVGKELARRAQEKGITAVVFDRGRFMYHGRVKAVAEGAREGGLKI
jgi:large subunit ribosomal protein L18